MNLSRRRFFGFRNPPPHRDEGEAGLPQVAVVGDACLPRRGIDCRVCGERCESAAIRFAPRLGGPPLPLVDPAACTGCADCLASCPAQALSLIPVPSAEAA